MRKLVAAIALALVLARTGTASAGAQPDPTEPGEFVLYRCENEEGTVRVNILVPKKHAKKVAEEEVERLFDEDVTCKKLKD